MQQRSSFGAVIEQQGRTRRWVAQQVKVSDSTVSRWCSGIMPIPSARLAQLAALLGVEESLITEQPADDARKQESAA